MTVSNDLWTDIPEGNASMLEWALCYARHGIHVFPVKPRSKTGYYCYPDYAGSPSEKYPDGNPYSWPAQASTDPERIRRFWTDHPSANICGTTGAGLLVLDLDKEHVNEDSAGNKTLISDGWERLRKWSSDTGLNLNLETAMSITGRGGNQLFYCSDPQKTMKGSSDIFRDNSGCDTRGDGNYVLLPPSIHPNGSRYLWEQSPDEYPVLKADQAVFTYWQGSTKTASRTGSDRFDPYMKVTSHRHDYLSSYVGWMLNAFPNLKQSQYEDMLRKKNAEDIFPPLGDNKDDAPDDLERTMFPEIHKFMINDGMRRQETQKQADQFMAAFDDEANWKSLMQTFPEPANVVQADHSSGLDRTPFHRWSTPNKNGERKPLDILDLPIAEDIIKKNHVFLLHGKLYLYEDGYYKADLDDTFFKSLIKEYIYPELVTDQRLTRVVKLLKAERSIKIQDSEINKYPKCWVCFKNGFLDLKTLDMHPHDPKYNNIVQIPHEWNPSHMAEGSITETFLKDFIKNPDDCEMFLEYAGLCMTPDMHFQKMLILRGEGGLGKSVLLRMMEWMIGDENISSITMQNLNDRFSPVFLYGKLLNSYADLSSEDMQNTAGIKTITGEDRIRSEYKGGDLFFFHPFCKLLFSANKIPKSRDEKTVAYYRRLLIIPFTKRAQHVPDLEEKLKHDIDSFITLSVQAAHRMYENGSILESDNSKKEVQDLYLATDTAMAFIQDCCETGTDCKSSRDELYSMYEMYCEREGRPSLSRQGFYGNLKDKGFSERYRDGYKWFHGIRFVSLTDTEHSE